MLSDKLEAHSEAYKKIKLQDKVERREVNRRNIQACDVPCSQYSPFPAPFGETPSPKLALTTKCDHCIKKQDLLEAPIHCGCFLLLRWAIGEWDFQGFTIFFLCETQPTVVSGRSSQRIQKHPWYTVGTPSLVLGDTQQRRRPRPLHHSMLNRPQTKPAITKHSHYCCLF